MTATDTEFDPFDAPFGEPPADIDVPEDALSDEFDDLLAGLDLEEQESGEAIRVPSSGRTYTNPVDVGLEDKMWVPILIDTAEAVAKHVPRMSSKTCIAKKDGKVYAIFDQVEAALRNGAEEVVAEVPLPYFVVTANHASDEIQRRFPYEIEAPVFTVKTALFKPQKNRKGYKNERGRTLRVATGATKGGDTVNLENMHEVADKMVGTIVMAQIDVKQSKTPKFRTRLDENKDPITVLINPEDGDAVKVFSPEDGSGYVVEGSGEVWDGNEALLVKIDNRHYAIRDSGENSGELKESYLPVNDYINSNAPFLPVPERKVQVEMLDESTCDGEITLGTVGAIAQAKPPGVRVDVLLRNGEKITAVWLGTQWNEVKAESTSEDGDEGEADEFSGDAVASL